jgi:hypothetical protein
MWQWIFWDFFFGPAKYFSDWQDFHVCQSEWLTTSQQVSGSLPLSQWLFYFVLVKIFHIVAIHVTMETDVHTCLELWGMLLEILRKINKFSVLLAHLNFDKTNLFWLFHLSYVKSYSYLFKGIVSAIFNDILMSIFCSGTII